VARAAREGDSAARGLFEQAARELAAVVHAVRGQLNVPAQTLLRVSYSGGMFRLAGLLKPMLEMALGANERRYRYEFVAPRLSPMAGAALYAAKLAGVPLAVESVGALARSVEGTAVEDDA
jgi:N-acetylglucosamine kinase-like BadF-type ATPase